MKHLLILMALPAAFLAGCASTEDRVSVWVGEPISDYIDAMHKPDTYASRTGWKEQKYPLKSGNWVYVAPYSEGCLIDWEVDARGVIVSYRLDGPKC